MRETLSAAEARRAALAAQGLARAERPATPGTRHLQSVMRRLGLVQIDSVNVFARAHHVPFFSRLGPYDPAAVDRLSLRHHSPWTEYIAHENCFIPTADWPLWRFRMAERRELYAEWLAANAATVEWVRAELATRGPLRPAEIETDAHRAAKGPWWDWSTVKTALELLWLSGEVAIAGRRGFERRYALAEDALPAEVLSREVARDDAVRELVRRAARAYGVATAADLADYHRFRDRPAVLAAIGELVESGELAPVRVAGWERAGRPIPAWLHREARIPRHADGAALLSPFDPLVWFRERAERMFDFDYRIEIYTPAAKRRYGYYSLPALVDDAIVARVDLKADRPAGVLRVQSAWWEPGFRTGHGKPGDPSSDHRADRATTDRITTERIAAELRAAARWQGLDEITVAGWGDAVDDLAGALGARRH
ncbi:MAG: winged helix-turn-helix domain-containing protein [Actinobacteria bacterium]|nr:winged helix-turn-helix domain-containing protein [Actinomycetota bacterium]